MPSLKEHHPDSKSEAHFCPNMFCQHNFNSSCSSLTKQHRSWEWKCLNPKPSRMLLVTVNMTLNFFSTNASFLRTGLYKFPLPSLSSFPFPSPNYRKQTELCLSLTCTDSLSLSLFLSLSRSISLVLSLSLSLSRFK